MFAWNWNYHNDSHNHETVFFSTAHLFPFYLYAFCTLFNWNWNFNGNDNALDTKLVGCVCLCHLGNVTINNFALRCNRLFYQTFSIHKVMAFDFAVMHVCPMPHPFRHFVTRYFSRFLLARRCDNNDIDMKKSKKLVDFSISLSLPLSFGPVCATI